MIVFDVWNYAFQLDPPQRHDTAQRSAFLQYQTYPANSVQGGGTLVAGNNIGPGKYWRITEPPQVYATHTAIVSSTNGGGMLAGSIAFQPLVDTSQSMG